MESTSRATSMPPTSPVIPANIVRQPSYPKSPRRRRRLRRKYGIFGLSYERWTSVLAVIVCILAILLAITQVIVKPPSSKLVNEREIRVLTAYFR